MLVLWLLHNAGSSGRIHCASSGVRVRCSSTRYGRRNAGSLDVANISRVRGDGARGGVHFVLPAVSEAPAPAVSAAPAPLAGCIAPVPAESVAPAPAVCTAPEPVAEWVTPVPAESVVPAATEPGGIHCTNSRSDRSTRACGGAHRSDSCSDHSPGPMMVYIAPAPASPVPVVERIATASAVLTVPAPLMEHFAPAPVVLTVQASLKEHIAPVLQ